MNVTAKKMRILYIDGEPRWEYKFIRRAIRTHDQSIDLVTMLADDSEQDLPAGVANERELVNGFPTKPEELFAYDGLIIGSMEASYFSPAQQQMIRDFADRRGGGVLFTGRDAIRSERRRLCEYSDGGDDAGPSARGENLIARLRRCYADGSRA